ncbi:Phosphatidylinositide phosphatase SAC1 [Allomyces arbusculus]|nr:Phosphatidylinositide phosphatase SAC1 [Allomyces arbusculus]
MASNPSLPDAAAFLTRKPAPAPGAPIHVLNDGSLVVEPLPTAPTNTHSTTTAHRRRSSLAPPEHVLVYALSLDSDTNRETLGSCQPAASFCTPCGRQAVVRECVHFGLIGVLDFSFAQYLLYIAGAAFVAEFPTSCTGVLAPVYKVTAVDALPIATDPYLSMSEEQYEAETLRDVLALFNDHELYFSHHADLTISVQEWGVASTSSIVGGNPDYALNQHLLRSPLAVLPPAIARDFLVQVAGFVGQSTIPAHAPSTAAAIPVVVTVISRIRTNRLGRRYYSRGLDPVTAHCSNTAETELVIWRWDQPDRVAAFVQWRGSVPLEWTQLPCGFEAKPAVVLSARPKLADPVRTYLDVTGASARFERTVLVDLLDLASHAESALSTAFAASSVGIDGATYVSCPVARRDRFAYSTAARTALAHLPRDGTLITVAESGRVVTTRQSVLPRTNCLDSIDRTNLVQYFLTESQVPALLSALGVAPSSATAVRAPLQRLWRANGHAIARWNLGTRAVCQALLLDAGGGGGAVEDAATVLARRFGTYFVDPRVHDALELVLQRETMDVRRHVVLQRQRSLDECCMGMVAFAFAAARKRGAPVAVRDEEVGSWRWGWQVLVMLAWVVAGRVAVWANGGRVEGLFRWPRSLVLAAEADDEAEKKVE